MVQAIHHGRSCITFEPQDMYYSMIKERIDNEITEVKDHVAKFAYTSGEISDQNKFFSLEIARQTAIARKYWEYKTKNPPWSRVIWLGDQVATQLSEAKLRVENRKLRETAVTRQIKWRETRDGGWQPYHPAIDDDQSEEEFGTPIYPRGHRLHSTLDVPRYSDMLNPLSDAVASTTEQQKPLVASSPPAKKRKVEMVACGVCLKTFEESSLFPCHGLQLSDGLPCSRRSVLILIILHYVRPTSYLPFDVTVYLHIA